MSAISIKSLSEIRVMAQAGQKLAQMMEQLLVKADVGVTTRELDEYAEELVRKEGVVAAFKGFQGYPFSLVTCVNEEVVHGMPSERVLVEGDLLTMDFGIIDQGFNADMARTKVIGNETPEQKQFLQVGQVALTSAIDQCWDGNRVGDISAAIQRVIEEGGYQVIRAFVGHGIGQELHEEPQIPGFGVAGTGALIRSGMVFAVEVMYTQGKYDVELLDDGWTAITRDQALSAMFENTVAVTAQSPQILTEIV